MGRLENGKWIDQWHNTKETQGRYVRKPSIYRNWITKDGIAAVSYTHLRAHETVLEIV